MIKVLKRCAAQLLVLVFYITGVAYRTGNNGLGMIKHLKEWADS